MPEMRIHFGIEDNADGTKQANELKITLPGEDRGFTEAEFEAGKEILRGISRFEKVGGMRVELLKTVLPY